MDEKIGPPRSVDAGGQRPPQHWTLASTAASGSSVPSRWHVGVRRAASLARSLLSRARMPRLNGTGPSCSATATPERCAATDSLQGWLGLALGSEQSLDTFWGLDPNRRPAHYALAQRVC